MSSRSIATEVGSVLGLTTGMGGLGAVDRVELPLAGLSRLSPGSPTGSGASTGRSFESSEASPRQWADMLSSDEEGTGASPGLELGGTGRGGEEGGEDDSMFSEELDVFSVFSRKHLVELYHDALVHQAELAAESAKLQHNIALYYQDNEGGDRGGNSGTEASIVSSSDHEHTYKTAMDNLRGIQDELAQEQRGYDGRIAELEAELHDRASVEAHMRSEFDEHKREVARNSQHSRKGTYMPPRLIQFYERRQLAKAADVSSVRLVSIRLAHKKDALQAKIEAMEKENGLHLIDFEQKKIENQTFNEKIEERNEELLKLRKKITTTVQILTHILEKLEFVKKENAVLREEILAVGKDVTTSRARLSKLKSRRDKLRTTHTKLRDQAGLVGDYELLRDFEKRSARASELREHLADLRERHRALSRATARYKAKQKAFVAQMESEMMMT